MLTLTLSRCLELHPGLGNLLLELKDLGLVARTDYEELLTNLARMEVFKCNKFLDISLIVDKKALAKVFLELLNLGGGQFPQLAI